MLAKKISFCAGAMAAIALAVALAGCSPTGPRALLRGKKYLDRGDIADAVAQFQTATTLLATNANAWNYYGVALQQSGRTEDAAQAYQTALKCDRDLVEAHFNLGCLWLEQNKPDAAKNEFTAYTLRRPNDPAGWLKLGFAQLNLDETVPAEKSFSTVLYLKPKDAEAYNGLGLASIQLNRPRDAAQFFAAAIRSRPDFAAALLNLATVDDQYLHDTRAALENYRAYLALTPQPANWNDVNAIALTLEKSLATAAVSPTKPVPPAPAPEPKPQPRIAVKPVEHVEASPRMRGELPRRTEPPAIKTASRESQPERPAAGAPPAPTQVVQVQPEPQIVTTPQANAAPTAPASLETPMPEPASKPGFWHRLFGSSKTQNPAAGVTPLPTSDETARAAAAAAAPVNFARYHYLSPRQPAAGDRIAASGAFTRAREFEQDSKWLDAMQWYQRAAQFDPSWFEAQYNAGVLAQRLRNYPLALASYETALAIRPDSADARYNFALALRAAGYPLDAVDQLNKILAAAPGDARAHLALANLYAQTLRDPAAARPHYQKVLELDPQNPAATDIRFWLSANPK